MVQTLTQRAYIHICGKLQSGGAAPGSRLSHRALAKEIGISFIPVREAMNQLVSKGIIEHHPGLGSFVPDPSNEELSHLYDLREALECHTVAKLAGKMSDADLVEMAGYNDELLAIIDELEQAGRSRHDPRQRERWLLADARFHITLLRAAGNPRVLMIVQELQLMSRIFVQPVESPGLETLRRTHAIHCQILEALQRGDANQARDAMAEHIRSRFRTITEGRDRHSVTEFAHQDAALNRPDTAVLQQSLRGVEQDLLSAAKRAVKEE